MARQVESQLSKGSEIVYGSVMRRFAYLPIALLIASALCSSNSFADQKFVVEKKQLQVVQRTQVVQNSKECECRAKGQFFSVGETTCLNGVIAICEMSQNVTNWRSTRNSCPNAHLSKPANFSRKI
jgi:hypothetical protein